MGVVLQARDLSKAEFLERLASFLEGQIPQDAMRKAWVRRQSLDMNMPFDTFASYLCGQYEPGALNWLKLCDHFPGLLEAIDGPRKAAGANDLAELRDLAQEFKRRVDALTVARASGKTGDGDGA